MAATVDAAGVAMTHGDLLREQVWLLRRLVALEEERRDGERAMEELAKAMTSGAAAKTAGERDPNDPRGKR